jgi:hypothetical protein
VTNRRRGFLAVRGAESAARATSLRGWRLARRKALNYDRHVGLTARGAGTVGVVGVVAVLVASNLVGEGIGSSARADSDDHRRRGLGNMLIARSTVGAQVRETVPIAHRRGQLTRAILSSTLPTVRKGDVIRFNGEVAISLTCPLDRCPGRPYGFNPHLRAEIVLARGRHAAGRGTLPVSRADRTACTTRHPNRNHHCPLTIDGGSIVIHRLGALPCPPSECRLNMVVDAYNRRAHGGELVIVGADLPDGTVKHGQQRLNVVVARQGAKVTNGIRRDAAADSPDSGLVSGWLPGRLLDPDGPSESWRRATAASAAADCDQAKEVFRL